MFMSRIKFLEKKVELLETIAKEQKKQATLQIRWNNTQADTNNKLLGMINLKKDE